MKTKPICFKIPCLLILNYFLLTSVGVAQAPIWFWSKNAGGGTYDVANSIAADASGNSYVAGYFNGTSITFGSTTLNNSSTDTSDVFIAKYDVGGNPIWGRSGTGSLHDRANSVATDASGNIYVTGYFDSPTITFDTVTLTNVSIYSDVFIVKYDPSGNVIWAKSMGGNFTDAGTSVAVDNAGNILLAGYFQSSPISFDTINLSNNGNYDMFIVKYDPNGNVLWADGRGGSNEDKAYSVAADGSDNVIVTGAFLSSSIPFDTDTVNYSGGAYTDIFIAKYNSGGNVSWAKSEGGTYLDEPNAVIGDATGNVYVSGIFYSSSIAFGTDTLNNSGTSFYGDMFLAKYDINGNAVWAKQAGAGTNNDWASSMDMDASGNIWVGGVFGSTISFDSITLTNEALFIAQYDVNGNALFATDVAGGMAYGISLDGFDDIHVAGIIYDSTITFGATPTLTNNGFYDVVVAQLGYTASLPDMMEHLNTVYPNPTTDIIHISSQHKIQALELYNSMGQKIASNSANEYTEEMDLSIYESGIYFLSIRTMEGTQIKKVLKRD